MPLKTSILPHTLQFTFEAGTSRGVLREKQTYFLKLWDTDQPDSWGLGEAGPLVGLSVDDRPDFAEQLAQVVKQVEGSAIPKGTRAIMDWARAQVPDELPSIRFALETAALDLYHGAQRSPFPGRFARGEQELEINGLIWMGDADLMAQRIEEKLADGFTTLKMKIGAIDFDKEIELLAGIRKRFGPDKITLRVDANGAFSPEDAPRKLRRLAALDLHSIEQPIPAGQPAFMKLLCKESPLPIALDEELIGVHALEDRQRLLDEINPPFIILKPTLVGGLGATAEWIELAEARNIGWWITSALESNVGLNAIAQFTAHYQPSLPQGLGTGQLYHNNVPSPLTQSGGWLRYDPHTPWDWSVLTA